MTRPAAWTHPDTRVRRLEERLSALCRPFRWTTPWPVQQKLCRRVERFLPELFVFVSDPAVPPDNNPA